MIIMSLQRSLALCLTSSGPHRFVDFGVRCRYSQGSLCSDSAYASARKGFATAPKDNTSEMLTAEDSEVCSNLAYDSKDACNVQNANKIPSVGKRRHYLMLLSYIGTRYPGNKFRNDLPSVERTLFKAYCEAGLRRLDRPLPRNPPFHLASRTEGGVSAVQQAVSFQCRIQPTNISRLKQNLNEILPDDTRVVGIRHVASKKFNARERCVLHTYTYTLPSFAFAYDGEQTDSTFRLTDKRRTQVNDILSVFVGTHNFFNFTTQVNTSELGCKRLVKSFTLLSNAHVQSGVEFSTLKVVGQRFKMQQIRKMVGLSIAVARGVLNRDSLNYAFRLTNLRLPLVPSTGLVLDGLSYDEEFCTKFDQLLSYYQAELEQFRAKILSTIAELELKDKLMSQWLMDDLPDATRKFLADVETSLSKCDDHTVKEANPVIMYILLRRDLLRRPVDWSVGALVGQASHASASVIWMFKDDPYVTEFMENCNSMHKLVWVPCEEQLMGISKLLVDAKIAHKLWFEQVTSIPTCLVIKPQPKQSVQQYVKDLVEFYS